MASTDMKVNRKNIGLARGRNCSELFGNARAKGKKQETPQSSKLRKFNWRRSQPQSSRGMDEVEHSHIQLQMSYGDTCFEESDIPGFAYNAETKRYFKVQPQASGPIIGFRESDLRENRRHSLFLAAQKQHIVKPCSSASRLPKLIQRRELHGSNVSQCSREITEMSMRSVQKEPSYVQNGYTGIGTLVSCKYLNVSNDGKTIVGCWIVAHQREGANDSIESSRIICFRVAANDDFAESKLWGGFGLNIGSSSHVHNLMEPNVVDIHTTEVSDDVTCMLCITSQPVWTMQGGISTLSRIRMEPVAELCAITDPEELNASRYNMRWTCQEYASSIAFNRHRMEIGIGLERNALLLNMLAEETVSVNSLNKSVISQTFSLDGNLMYMGLLRDKLICSDLRLNNSIGGVATFDESFSVGWLKLLHTKPNVILAEDYHGKIKFWDIRVRKPLMTIEGSNSPYKKTPIFVDRDERFIFSASCDGFTKVWSTYNGEKLCEFPSHQPRQGQYKPQIAYASNWGGFAGNAAILIATGSDFRVHELSL